MGKLIIKREYDKVRAYQETDWTMTFDINEDTTISEIAEMFYRVMCAMEFSPECIDKYFYYDWNDEE